MIADEISGAWGDPNSRLDLSWPLTVRLWRVADGPGQAQSA